MRGHPKTKWNAKQLPVVLPRPPLSCTVGEVEATPKALDQHDFLLSCKFLAGNELWHANVKQYVQREPWQKKTTFFLHCILLKFYCSAFCQGIYKSALFDVLSTWEVRSRLDGSTGPAWDDDTVVKAQCQRNWRIIHQHHAFHGAAQTTQILQLRKWKSERGMLVMRGQGTKPPFIFGTVFLLSLLCLNTLPWGKHHRVPRNADLKFVKKHGKGFGKKQDASNINT